MSEFGHTLLLLALAGAAITVIGSAVRYLRDQDARLRACLVKAVGRPDALVIGAGKGAALHLASDRIVIAWDKGAWRLDYALEDLRGGELIIDNQVAARILPGEPRRVLDQVVSSAARVTLRLIFDDPARPHFDIDLFRAGDEARRDRPTPAGAIEVANAWLARIDALQRRPRNTATVAQPQAPADDEAPWDEDEDDPA